MQELTNAVTAAMNRMAESGAIEKLIEEKLSKTLDEVIGNALRSYSDFGKALSEQVGKCMGVSFDSLEIQKYNDFVLKVVERQLNAYYDKQAREQIEKSLSEILEEPPTEIKLSKLVEQMVEANQDDANENGWEHCTCTIELSNYGFHHIYLDPESDKKKYECSIQLHVDKEGHVYSLKIDDSDVKTALFIGPFYNLQRLIFQIYAAKTKLIVDEDAVSTYYRWAD